MWVDRRADVMNGSNVPLSDTMRDSYDFKNVHLRLDISESNTVRCMNHSEI
jgi:hypothetical protein